MAHDTEHLLQRLFRWETERKDNTFLTQPLPGGTGLRTYTFQQAMNEARKMATHLTSLGLEPGSSIAILSKNCAHMFLADIAIWMAGHVSVALYPTLTRDTVGFILAHANAKLLFVGNPESWDTQKEGVPKGIPCISFPDSPATDVMRWNDIVGGHAPQRENHMRPTTEPAVILYTSGSTGKPKGVVHSLGTISCAAAGLAQVMKLQQERFISYLPLAHAFERAAVEAMSMWLGAEVFFVDSLETFLSDLQRAKPTLFHSVPRLWLKFQQGVFQKMPPEKLAFLLKIPIVNRLLRRKVLSGLGLGEARLAVSGSAPIPPELIDWYRALGLELLEGYAMTENFAYSHLALPSRTRAGYVGEPLPGVECKLSPQGEVLVKSPATMLGYHQDPELTRDSFTEDGFLKTGDRGEIDEANRLRLTGRVKELFKTSKGKYVAPAPIENLLNADNHVEQSCVTGLGLPQPFGLIVLAEVLRPRTGDPSVRGTIDTSLRHLLARVNQVLDDHEKLEFLVVVDEAWKISNGMLTPTLKIRREFIEARYSPDYERWYEKRQPVIWL